MSSPWEIALGWSRTARRARFRHAPRRRDCRSIGEVAEGNPHRLDAVPHREQPFHVFIGDEIVMSCPLKRFARIGYPTSGGPTTCQDTRARNRAARRACHLTRNWFASEGFETRTPSSPDGRSASSASFDHSSANLSHATLLASSWAASARRRHRSEDRRQAAGWFSGIVFASRRGRLLRLPS